MAFELKPLPYSADALEPHISARTLEIHHGKHHGGYVKKLNKALEGNSALDTDLETLIKTLEPGKPFNFAAQIWNHDFYWRSMSPSGGGKPGAALGEQIERQFQSFGKLREAFAQAASDEFGSGWAWLTVNGQGELQVVSTTDAENPLQSGLVPLIGLDVWEHAYYLDYQNERGKYIDVFLSELANWEFAEDNFLHWQESVESIEEVT